VEQPNDDGKVLERARAGDESAFRGLVEPFRRALFAHCYRMLGSAADAEDALQEALVRAWKGLPGFEGRSSLRSWLYRIATNTSLDVVERRPRRMLPQDRRPALSGPDGFAPVLDPVWVEPCPDDRLDLDEPALGRPDARYAARESVTLAFLAALQVLPPLQRAVLLLNDVVGWSAAETAEHLATTAAAVNSALQRARATLEARFPRGMPEASVTGTDDAATRELLGRYVRAWEAADLGALTGLLREDAVLTMPPMEAWFAGREAIRSFLAGKILAGDGPTERFRFRAGSANGGPAFAVYARGEDGAFHPFGVQLLTLRDGLVAEIVSWLDPRLVTAWGFPATI
jgi:RNA polymerase sigma-70 factor (ECF subfamily)